MIVVRINLLSMEDIITGKSVFESSLININNDYGCCSP